MSAEVVSNLAVFLLWFGVANALTALLLYGPTPRQAARIAAALGQYAVARMRVRREPETPWPHDGSALAGIEHNNLAPTDAGDNEFLYFKHFDDDCPLCKSQRRAAGWPPFPKPEHARFPQDYP